jgi:hypothetical protein
MALGPGFILCIIGYRPLFHFVILIYFALIIGLAYYRSECRFDLLWSQFRQVISLQDSH